MIHVEQNDKNEITMEEKKILDENLKKVSGGTGEETKKLIEMSDILPPPSLTLRGGGFSVKNTNVSR